MDHVKYVARWIAMVPCALAAVLLAPDRRLHAAYALAALSVLISGITLYLAAEMGDLWAIWEIAWTGIGSLAVVLWIRKGEIDLT